MKRKSFTLIELVVVVAIIAVLAAVVAPNAFKAIEKAKIATFVSDLKTFKSATMSYYADTGDWGVEVIENPEGFQVGTIPDSNNGNTWDESFFLTDNGVPGWDGPYLNKKIANGPWGVDYVYFFVFSDTFNSSGDVTGERGIFTGVGNIDTEEKIDKIIDDGDISKGLFRRDSGTTWRFAVEGKKAPVFFLISRDGPID